MWFGNYITLCGFGIKFRYMLSGYSVFVKITKDS